MRVVYYTIPSCKNCCNFAVRLERVCVQLDFEFVQISIDDDPFLAIAILKEYENIVNSVPFFAIFSGDERINTFEGMFYDDDDIYKLLIKHERR